MNELDKTWFIQSFHNKHMSRHIRNITREVTLLTSSEICSFTVVRVIGFTVILMSFVVCLWSYTGVIFYECICFLLDWARMWHNKTVKSVTFADQGGVER